MISDGKYDRIRTTVATLITGLSLLMLSIGSSMQPVSQKGLSPLTLFDFSGSDETPWVVVNDGVMGGRSQGRVSIEDGILRFTGVLVTRGGGFTSIRAEKPADLSQYDGLELRIRGEGRTFEVQVDDGTRMMGRIVSRRAPFDTTEDWEIIRIPFRTLRSSVFGRSVSAPPIEPANVRSIGFFILDGIDGPFRLEVDVIRAYRHYDEAAGPRNTRDDHF